MMKKMLTGNLNAPVDSCPPFMGKERNLLRAQIARIQHNCQICPKGTFEIDEDTREQKFAEEAPLVSVDDLKTLESWSHAYPLVLKVGRCTHSEPVGMDEDAKIEFMEKLAGEDKTEDRFKTINEDITVPGLEAAW
jgi:radial spoke head protein 4A